MEIDDLKIIYNMKVMLYNIMMLKFMLVQVLNKPFISYLWELKAMWSYLYYYFNIYLPSNTFPKVFILVISTLHQG